MMGDSLDFNFKTEYINFNPHLLSLELAASNHLYLGAGNWTIVGEIAAQVVVFLFMYIPGIVIFVKMMKQMKSYHNFVYL